jgi:hypothetical protein
MPRDRVAAFDAGRQLADTFRCSCANPLTVQGCVAAADTEHEVCILIQEAGELHLESLRESGQHVPPPSHTVGYVEVLTPA